MKKILTSLLVGLVALVASATAASASYTTSSVNMRSGPSTGYSVIRVLSRGTWVDVLWCDSGWCKVAAKGDTGYVSSRYISSTKPIYKKKKVSNYHKHGRYGHSHRNGLIPHSHGGTYGWYPRKYYSKPGLYFHFRF
jgi:uncharacterized protein YraI